MPDSNSPWTPDDAFWNEAWADMETRLDRKRRRRLLLPLLLLLTALAAGTLVLWDGPLPGVSVPSERATAEPAAIVRTAPTTTPIGAGEEALATTELPDGGGLKNAETPAPKPLGAPGRSPQNETNASGIPEGPGTRAPRPNETNSPLEDASRATPPPTAVEPSGQSRTSQLVAGVPLPTMQVDYSKNLDLEPVVAAAPIITPADPFHSFNLAAGTSVYPTAYLPGTYLQFTRLIPAGKWFVPVGLRYDYTRRELRSTATDDPRELISVNDPTFSGSVAYAQGGEAIREPRRLKMHTLGLRSGVGRRVSNKITLSAGLDLSYILAGSGPTYSVTDSAGVVLVSVAEERFTRSAYGGGANQDFAPAVGSPAPIVNPYLNRWQLSAWMRADYRLSGNLHLTLGYTPHISPLYREGAPSVSANRIELGFLLAL
ncbi:hypothetical protein [Neolewinella litorea]|uniref:Uncharacterized protein n=1 Tax=Neolewinella litorea TaxID=2562452 RepID=A0A4S4NTN3_9BACT|nr:hypothetical protein [Neolewinella litorea]THH41851.1 hypothetical protein E4021_04490 [Neolewinella litorea]